MAEYYPLLVKAVGRLPNSTPEARRVVYERARKALIGQLRTQHPPVPDEDIERESVELDRAVQRLEAELANGGVPAAAAAPADATKPAEPIPPAPSPSAPRIGSTPSGGGGAIGPAEKRPIPPLRPKTPRPPPFAKKSDVTPPLVPTAPTPPLPSDEKALALSSANKVVLGPKPSGQVSSDQNLPAQEASKQPPSTSEPPKPLASSASAPPLKPPRSDKSRPIAPQASRSKEPKRRLWIIPAGIGVVVALVAIAAWKLRDRPETIARTKPAEQSQVDSGKIAERVGGPAAPETEPSTPPAAPSENVPSPPPAEAARPQAPAAPAPNNPELPVAHRAALLVEAPDQPNKVKTFLGTVVWRLNSVAQGATDAVGLAVQADIELPDDKMKVTVTFEKNADASLAASHTIKVRFSIEPGSYSGNVKQISTPQMRPEANPSGEALAGVTVPIVPNSFLVGLSPGNAEAANIDLMRRLQWIDIPMLLDNGKIAKLTFEKSDSGQRDLNEAFTSWTK